MPPPSEGSTGTQSGSGVAGGTHYAAVHNTSSRDIIMIGCGSDKRAGKYRQMEDYERIKTIRKEDLKLKRTIGCRSGYYVHAGHNEGRAVIVKVFSRGLGLSVQQRLKATAALSSELMHPNILHMEGISSLTSLVHFIVYEDVYWKNAEGPLAVALKVDLKRSITLGFKMVEGFSAGVDYLFAQGISLDLENLDVFLDVDDRFILSFTVPQLEGAESDAAQSQEPEDRAWRLFNALCEKASWQSAIHGLFQFLTLIQTLLSANRVLHHEEIKRDPTVLDAVRPSLFAKNPVRSWSRSSPFSRSASSSDSSPQTEFEDELPLTLRREYVWRTVDRGKQSLAVVANQIALDLDLNLSPINRVNQTDGRNPHRCSGYLREEVTLATTTPDSAIVIYDTPSLLETCCICHEVVAIHETFRCRCGEPVPGSGRTVKCRECKLWSHSDCVGNPLKEFACGLCARSISSPAVYSARTSSAAPTSLAVQRPQVIVPTSTPSAPATPLLSASSLTMPNNTYQMTGVAPQSRQTDGARTIKRILSRLGVTGSLTFGGHRPSSPELLG
ncbi:hypothetical protein C8R47DRAFT_1242447 [Mycena vitilis]|nr:hypothetical protein C8R47DRAFT_1242447 [Mycena vitilis]